jgi:hypothetical protein
MSYGIMPTKEQFDSCWDKVDAEEGFRGDKFHFGNDPRIGTDALSQEELWKELNIAFSEYQEQDDIDEMNEVGDWISSVLYCLDIEWI